MDEDLFIEHKINIVENVPLINWKLLSKPKRKFEGFMFLGQQEWRNHVEDENWTILVIRSLSQMLVEKHIIIPTFCILLSIQDLPYGIYTFGDKSIGFEFCR